MHGGDEKAKLECKPCAKLMILQMKWPHARHRFRRESILFTKNFVAGDIGRNTRRNHTLPPRDAVCQFTLDDRKVSSPIFRQNGNF